MKHLEGVTAELEINFSAKSDRAQMFSFSTIHHFLGDICSKLLLFYLDFHMN